jgi:hypothetical protein
MKLVYIAGPYRAKSKYFIGRNISIARYHARLLWQKGYAVLCPHMNTAHFDGICPDEVFLEGTMEMLRRCDLIYLLPNWRDSEGAKAEYAEAQRLGIPRLEIDDLSASK